MSELRKKNTWGQRLEILVFCYLYNCEIFIATTSENNQFKFESTTTLFNEYLTHKPKFDIKRTSYIASVHAQDILRVDNKPKNHYVFLKEKNAVILHDNIPQRSTIMKLNTLKKYAIGKAQQAFDNAIAIHRKSSAQTDKIRTSKTRKKRERIPRIINQKSKRIETSNIIKICPEDMDISDYRNIKKIWIELDGKLHEQLPIAKCMKNFQDDISKLHLELPKPCIRCGRAWFSAEKNKHEEICNICLKDDGTFCNECALHHFDEDFQQCVVCDANQELGNPNLFSVFNHMQVGPPVPQIADLYQEELSLISICIPMVRVFRKTGNRFGYKDHCICLPQAINKLCSLPRPLGKMSIMWMLREGKNDTFKRVKIRRKKVETALKWLIKNNPLYNGFEINWENLETLPEEEVDIKDIPKITIDNDTFASFDDQPLDEDIINEYDMDTKMSEPLNIRDPIIEDDYDTENEDDNHSTTSSQYNADDDSLYMSDKEPSENEYIPNQTSNNEDAQQNEDDNHSTTSSQYNADDDSLYMSDDESSDNEYIPNQTLNNEDEKQFELFELPKPKSNLFIASSDNESDHDTMSTNDLNTKRKHINITGKTIHQSTKKIKISYPSLSKTISNIPAIPLPNLNDDMDTSGTYNKRNAETALLSMNNSNIKKYKHNNLPFHAFANTSMDVSANDSLMEDPLLFEHDIESSEIVHVIDDEIMIDNDWSQDDMDVDTQIDNTQYDEGFMDMLDDFPSDIEEAENDENFYKINLNNDADDVHIFEDETEDIGFTPVYSKRDRALMDQDKARIAADCISGNIPAPFRQTQCMTYLPTDSESNKLEIDILRNILKPPEDGIENEKPKLDKSQPFGSHSNPLDWPEVTKYGIDEFNCSNLAAACFPDLFPYGRGDFTQRGRPRSVSIRQARKFYEQYADYTNGQLSYRFAKHKFWSFWIFNRANRHTLLSATNAFIAGTPTTKDMSREQMLAELEKGTSNILTMGLGRYEANLEGSDGFWHQQCQELQAAIREANYPTAFYTFTYADAHCPELYRLLPFPDHLSQEDILKLPYEEREKVLSENQHIAAWFFYKRFQSFSKHMRNCLDTDWYWQRIESQFRTAFHTHGCLRMHNDHDLMKNCHKALLGFLALQKIEHIDLLDTEDVPDQNLFSTDEIKKSLLNVQPLITEFLSAFTLCRSDNVDKKGTCYYIGIAFDQENENSDDVRSGQQEKKTSIQQGMLNPKVVLTINDLSSCDAYTLEYELLKWLKLNAENVTLNKSALFGLGNRPNNWKTMKCTLTLLKGQYRSARYRAYPELDLIFEEIDPDDTDLIKTKLNSLIEEGEEAKRTIVQFVDYMVSTYNPSMEDTGDERPLPRGKDVPHPCSYEFNAFDAEANNCTSEKDISFQTWLKDNETKHEFLNQVQGPHDHSKGSCQEKNNKTEEIKCRFHFPFDLIENRYYIRSSWQKFKWRYYLSNKDYHKTKRFINQWLLSIYVRLLENKYGFPDYNGSRSLCSIYCKIYYEM